MAKATVMQRGTTVRVRPGPSPSKRPAKAVENIEKSDESRTPPQISVPCRWIRERCLNMEKAKLRMTGPRKLMKISPAPGFPNKSFVVKSRNASMKGAPVAKDNAATPSSPNIAQVMIGWTTLRTSAGNPEPTMRPTTVKASRAGAAVVAAVPSSVGPAMSKAMPAAPMVVQPCRTAGEKGGNGGLTSYGSSSVLVMLRMDLTASPVNHKLTTNPGATINNNLPISVRESPWTARGSVTSGGT
mmetsp:Transcript_83897/g.211567  ORF Transcript_83897/g.211567 Transcript_83897/m.211567 type:complete len:243 (-) Transcript_83897:307-1035(-)